MSVDIFTCGGISLDNVIAADGRLYRGQIGGNAIYAAVGARQWSLMVGAVTRMPSNLPTLAHQALSRSGLDLSGLAAESGAVDCEEWFFYRGDGGRRDHLFATPTEADEFGVIGDRVSADVVERWEHHLATRPTRGLGYAQFRLTRPVEPAHIPETYWRARAVHLAPNDPDAQIALARAARARGLIVTCDPGFHARGFDADRLTALLAIVDAFLPSEQELAVLCPGLDAEAALRALRRLGPAILGAKRAAAGSMVLDRDGVAVTVPVLPVRAADPTGAGDAYCGGFLAGLTRFGDPVTAACMATVSASFAVESPGALYGLMAGDDERQRRLTLLRSAG